MSTRGTFGFRLDGVDRISYNHSDSYPSYLGVRMLEQAGELLAGDRDTLKAQVRGITMVEQGGTPNQTVQALLAGEIQFTFISAGTVIGQIKGGKLKAIAVSGGRRFPVLPGAPTLGESGLAGVDDRIWFGLFAPAGTPRAAVAAIYAELVRIVGNDSFREQRLVSQGWEPALMPGEEFGRFLAADRKTAGDIVRTLGIRLE